MRALPLHKAGVGSAVNDTTRELGGALGVAVFGSIVASRFHASLTGSVSNLSAAASRSLGAALQRAATLPSPRSAALANAARHAYVHAFDLSLLIAVVVALVAASLISWLLRPAATVAAEEHDAVVLEAA